MIGWEIKRSYELVLLVSFVFEIFVKSERLTQGKEKASKLRHVDEGGSFWIKVDPRLSKGFAHVYIE